MTFDDMMNREVDTAFIKVIEKYNYNNDGNKTYTGIYVEMIVGIGNSMMQSFDFRDDYFHWNYSTTNCI